MRIAADLQIVIVRGHFFSNHSSVSLVTVLRFQFGQAAAIQAVAVSRTALAVGIWLVLLTAVARNYDQKHVLESPLWLFGPLLFSLFSGTFLFTVLSKGFISRHSPAGKPTAPLPAQWRSFMGLFWMTAPIAWLYAIPAERMFESYQAAQANLVLLGIVAFWRVLLMSRIVSVLLGLAFLRALGWVLVPACLEALAIVFLGGIFSPTFGRAVMASMSGMRNAPEEDLLLGALGTAAYGALITLGVVLTVLAIWRFRGAVHSFPVVAGSSRLPVVGLLGLTAFWIAVAIPAQHEQKRFVAHASLIERGEYREAIDYLARHRPDDFPPSRRLEPNPYEFRVFKQLPKVMAALDASDPEWVRQLHLEQMETVLSHRRLRSDPAGFLEMFLALERLPEAESWIERNRAGLPKLRIVMETRHGLGSEAEEVERKLIEVLQRLGVDPAE
jgi:hypothetical protein